MIVTVLLKVLLIIIVCKCLCNATWANEMPLEKGTYLFPCQVFGNFFTYLCLTFDHYQDHMIQNNFLWVHPLIITAQ